MTIKTSLNDTKRFDVLCYGNNVNETKTVVPNDKLLKSYNVNKRFVLVKILACISTIEKDLLVEIDAILSKNASVCVKG